MERYSLWGVVWDLCKGPMIIFKYNLGPLIDQTMDSHESFFIFIATTIASHHDDSWQKGVVTHFQRCSAYMWTCTYADLHACRYANLVTFYLLAQSHFFFCFPCLLRCVSWCSLVGDQGTMLDALWYGGQIQSAEKAVIHPTHSPNILTGNWQRMTSYYR